MRKNIITSFNRFHSSFALSWKFHYSHTCTTTPTRRKISFENFSLNSNKISSSAEIRRGLNMSSTLNLVFIKILSAIIFPLLSSDSAPHYRSNLDTCKLILCVTIIISHGNNFLRGSSNKRIFVLMRDSSRKIVSLPMMAINIWSIHERKKC